jgi:hypothetical protein
MTSAMTAADLLDLFVATLVRDAGGTRRHWRLVIGKVTVHSLETHTHCNWSIHPSGNGAAVEAVERVADDLRARHPIVREG